jgi:exosortase/archaeosortase family protein
MIAIPGMQVEMADACSGFNKLITFVLFGLLYGYIFDLPLWKRVLLIAAAVPISIAANIVRVGSILVVSAHSNSLFQTVHDLSETVVVLVGMALFIAFGSFIGCKQPRFSI